MLFTKKISRRAFQDNNDTFQQECLTTIIFNTYMIPEDKYCIESTLCEDEISDLYLYFCDVLAQRKILTRETCPENSFWDEPESFSHCLETLFHAREVKFMDCEKVGNVDLILFWHGCDYDRKRVLLNLKRFGITKKSFLGWYQDYKQNTEEIK